MKKFWSKLVALVLGVTMALGVGFAVSRTSRAIPVYAASPATLTFTAQCGGSGTDSDGNTWTVTSDAAESTYDSTKGIHYGTGKKAVSYLNLTTSGITGTITQIVVNASGASGTSAKLDVSVGGSAFDSQKSLTSSAVSYTLTGSASGTVLIEITQTSATKALYCKSISVTYTAGPTPVKTLESITVSGSLEKISYTTAESWSHSGLIATGNYSDSSTADITSDVTWSYDPATPTVGTTQVKVTATLGTISGNKTCTGITVTEVNYYVLDPVSTGDNVSPHNSYAAAATATIDSIGWSVTGNSNMVPWRIGGKSITGIDREIYSTTAITEEVSKIEVTHGTASSITVNSWTVIVASDAAFTNIISTLTPTFAASDTTTINRPSGVSWKNAYYKFIYNVTVTGNNNKFLEFTKATFYYEQESAGVAAWCASFLSTVICDGGATPPSTTAWSTMNTSYNALSSEDKLALATLSNEATARYDYIVGKYNPTGETDPTKTNYAHFITSRTIHPLGSSRIILNSIIGDNTSAMTIVIIASIISISTLALFILLKKKRYN